MNFLSPPPFLSLLFISISFTSFSQINPTAPMEGFQIMSQGNFTIGGNAHVHGPTAVGGDMILDASFAELNKDNVGSYTCPGDNKTTGLLVKGKMIWTAGQANLQNQKYIHIGNSIGSEVILYNSSFTKVQSTADNAKSITLDVNQNTPVFNTDPLSITSAFTEMSDISSEISNQVANLTLSGTAPNYAINSLANGTNYIKLTQAQYTGIQGINFNNVRPTAAKVLVITVAVTSNFTTPNLNITGLQNSDSRFLIFNFEGPTKTITMSTSNLFFGTIYAPNHNFIKTGNGNIEGNIAAKSVSITTGEWHVQPFEGLITFTPLPVKFKYINVSLLRVDHIISWGTESEINNDHFKVERSFDTESWEVVAITKAKLQGEKSNNYNEKLINASTQTTYYRVAQVDLDGTNTYSDMVSIQMQNDKSISNIEVYPNPSNSILNITSIPKDSKITIINSIGTKVFETKASDHLILDTEKFVKGQYFIQVLSGNSAASFPLILNN